ncbi:MAG: hypothetical protein ACI4JS_00120 [Oscillospiraceae bacterium]
MTKRAFCLVLALVLPIVMLCGCSGGEPLSKQEYFDEVAKRALHYLAFQRELSRAMIEYETNGTPIDREANKQRANEAKKAIKEIKSFTPPDDYKEYHSDLCDGADSVLPYINSVDKICAAKDKEKYLQAKDKAWELDEDCTFLDAWLDFLIAVTAEGEVEIDLEKVYRQIEPYQ